MQDEDHRLVKYSRNNDPALDDAESHAKVLGAMDGRRRRYLDINTVKTFETSKTRGVPLEDGRGGPVQGHPRWTSKKPIIHP